MFLPILFCTTVFCVQWINIPSINFDVVDLKSLFSNKINIVGG